jgi:hypothetical protein
MSTPNGSAKGKAEHPMVSSGNPRVTVAFPFSKIDINEPSGALRDIAALVAQLAEQAAKIAGQAAPDLAPAADHLAAQATLLAHRLSPAS